MLQSLLLVLVSLAALVACSDPKIVGGFEADQNATMHQVSIRQRSVDLTAFGYGHICGGSLINNRTVLTAAHCVVDLNSGRRLPASTFRIVGGSVERREITENTVIVDVDKIYVHANFNTTTIVNDIALMILNQSIPDDHPTLKPIAQASSKPATATSCQSSGWGTTVEGQNASPTRLLAVNVTVVSMEQCNSTDSYNGHITDGMLCAGEAGKDSCQGDSGGPLVCDGVLAGVVSHGYHCGWAGFPGIYSDVAYYREWIETCLAGGCSGAGMVGLSWGLFVLLVALIIK